MDHTVEPVADLVRIEHAPVRSCFEAHVRGRHVATLEYRLSGPAVVLSHTHLVRGEDAATRTRLIDTALDVLVRSGHYAVALCPHVRAFLSSHPDRHLRVDTRFLDPVTPRAC